MRRFVCYNGLFDPNVFAPVQSWTFSGYLLICFDICGNSHEYARGGESGPSFLGMVQAATLLCKSFSDHRSRVVDRQGPSPASIAVLSRALHTQYTEFITALGAWHRATSGDFKARSRASLFNMYDTQEGLRKGIRENEGCCVRKPYIQTALDAYAASTRTLEEQFLSNAATFDGAYLLDEIKDEYLLMRGKAAPPLSVPTTTTAGVSPGASGASVMHTIVNELRSTGVYTAETIHHESVLDMSFRVKWSHRRFDDPCMLTASCGLDAGYVECMRRRMHSSGNTGPLYRYVQLLIQHIRLHLESIGIHCKRGKILGCLSDARWQSLVETGDVEWCDVYQMLKTTTQAVQCSVGSEKARLVLYKQRVAERFTAKTAATALGSRLGGGNGGAHEPCSDVARGVTGTPRLYAPNCDSWTRRNHAAINSRGSAFNVLDKYPDSPGFCLHPREYVNLVNKVVHVFEADKTCTPCELASTTIDILVDISNILSTLDVSLANAEISVTRSHTWADNVDTERVSFDGWFARGLRTDHTLAWLQSELGRNSNNSSSTSALLSAMDVHRIVFNSYVSLITGDGGLELEEEKYPELLLLDIAYIQAARSAFYGQVIQAAVLVVVGKRLTEMHVPVYTTKCCLDRLSKDATFTALGRPETCRAAAGTVESLRVAVCDVLTRVMAEHVHPGSLSYASLLREVSAEASHAAYPSSPVASYLARKWAAAMRMGVGAVSTYASREPEHDGITPGDGEETGATDAIDTSSSQALSATFKCPEATRVAFCSGLLLPNAALCLSRELHSSVAGLVARSWFNTSVHLVKYTNMLSQVQKSGGGVVVVK
jgi:hypothetical protein